MAFWKRNTDNSTTTPTSSSGTGDGMVVLVKTAAVSLTKNGISTTQRALVYLVLDRSGSMANYYRSGAVQRFSERVLALASNLDDDGEVPTVMFSNNIDGQIDLTIGQHEGAIDQLHRSSGRMGGTVYAMPIEWIIGHYLNTGASEPAFVVFQTDGAPNDRNMTRMLLQNAVRYPIKWDFHGWGPDTSFLDELDDLNEDNSDPGVWDNVSTLRVGANPDAMPDGQLFDHMAASLSAALSALNPGSGDES
jgi:hypothetical protein